MGTTAMNKYAQIHCLLSSKRHKKQGDISKVGSQDSSKEGGCQIDSLTQKTVTPTDDSPACEAHNRACTPNIIETYRQSSDAHQSKIEKRRFKRIPTDHPTQVMTTSPNLNSQKPITNLKLYLFGNNLATKFWTSQQVIDIAISAEQNRPIGSIRRLRELNAINDTDEAPTRVYTRRTSLMQVRRGSGND
jgi:hypothetical protein